MKILRESDLKEILKIQDKKVRALMRSPQFPSKKIGGSYFVEEQDFIEWWDKLDKEFKLNYKGV